MLRDYDYHFKVYLDKCIALVATMIIKSSKEAKDMSDSLYVKKGIDYDPSDKTSWIYYHHIAGEYHPSDEPMYVYSVDTTERIIFNKENLKQHKNTKKEYSYGTHKYEELVYRYPDKELLIKGILNPTDMETAILADDGTILSYDKTYIEFNEYGLFEKLQDRCYGLFDRWYQKQYNIDNDLYNVTFMGVLYQKLLEAIMEFRLENCLTNEAHSFHYQRYLASHGFLDFYLEHLTIKQSLILYKNIRWVEKYVGQRFTQRWLIAKILTLRNIPLSEYNIIQTYQNIIDDVKAIANFQKVSLNGLEAVDNAIDTLSLKTMMNKEDPLAPFNLREREFEEKEARELMAESLSSELKTKILHSNIIDYTDSEDNILPNMLMDQWIDMADRGMYKAYILLTHPITGETIPLTGKNALLLFTYAFFQINGIKDDCIPDYTIGLAPRKNKPTAEQLRSVIPNNTLISDDWINLLIEEYHPLIPIINRVDFYHQANERFLSLNKLLDLAKKDEHLDATTYKIVSAYNLYATRLVSFRTDEMKTFSQFLSSIAFDIKNMVVQDWEKVANDVYKQALGLDNANIKSMSNVSRAMISLMTKLSSYSVHYIRDINEQPIKAMGFRGLRLDGDGVKKTFTEQESSSSNFASEIIDDDTRTYQIVNENIDEDGDNVSVKVFSSEGKNLLEFYTDPSVKFIEDTDTVGLRINTDSFVRLGSRSWLVGDNLTGIKNPLSLPNLPGMQSWISLPNKIKRLIADQYGTDLVWDENEENNGTPKQPLKWGIRNSDLTGLDYHEKE